MVGSSPEQFTQQLMSEAPRWRKLVQDTGARWSRRCMHAIIIGYHNKHVQRIWQEPRGLAAGYRWPQYSIHRGELQMILYRAAVEKLGAGRIHLGHHLVRAEQQGEHMVAHFADEAGAPCPRPAPTC